LMNWHCVSKPENLSKQVADGASERWFYKFAEAHPKDDGISSWIPDANSEKRWNPTNLCSFHKNFMIKWPSKISQSESNYKN